MHLKIAKRKGFWASFSDFASIQIRGWMALVTVNKSSISERKSLSIKETHQVLSRDYFSVWLTCKEKFKSVESIKLIRNASWINFQSLYNIKCGINWILTRAVVYNIDVELIKFHSKVSFRKLFFFQICKICALIFDFSMTGYQYSMSKSVSRWEITARLIYSSFLVWGTHY